MLCEARWRPFYEGGIACGYLFADGACAERERVDGRDFGRSELVGADVDVDPMLRALEAGIYIITVGA